MHGRHGSLSPGASSPTPTRLVGFGDDEERITLRRIEVGHTPIAANRGAPATAQHLATKVGTNTHEARALVTA